LDIHARSMLAIDGLRLSDVRCRTHASGWSAPDVSPVHRIVLVRDGLFRRRGSAGEGVLDATGAYLRVPGDEHEIAHPVHGGDRFTSIELSPALAEAAGAPATGSYLRTSRQADLEHRLLLAALARGEDEDAEERALALVANVLRTPSPPRARAAHRRLVHDVQELLTLDPALTLQDLGRRLSYSPHHISRVFAAVTGASVASHRRRLRVRWVAERLAEGQRDLARLATEVGLTDASHLTRTVRRELGLVPSALRTALAPSREAAAGAAVGPA
jgi:AraC-like DNA-binding protein